MRLTLTLLSDELAVCRLPAGEPMPDWVRAEGFAAAVWTADETSVVCAARSVPEGITADGPWRAFVVAGPLDFSLTGILLSIAQPLAEAGIGIFAVSTYDTDYVLVKAESVDAARAALSDFGHRVLGERERREQRS